MKKQINCLLFFSALILLTMGCGEEEKPDQGVQIEGIPETLTVSFQGGIQPVNIKVTSGDGLVLFRILEDGQNVLTDYFTERPSFSTEYSYFPKALDVGREILIVFEAVDKDGDIGRAELRINVIDSPNTIRVSADISENTVWEGDKIYILTKTISVLPGAELTLHPGVIVKADYKIGDEYISLVVHRGAKINAQGTKSKPIIFTSVLDYVMSGEIASGNTQITFNWGYPWWGAESYYQFGYWGGLVILGNAKGSFPQNSIDYSLEGNFPSDQAWIYGGDNVSDNSGVLKYVSIRYGGAGLKGESTNSLTLAGVGHQTMVENVEIYAGYRDAVNILGGSVNLNNLIINLAADDGVEIGYGWNGELDNFYIDGFGDVAFQIDGPKGDYYGGNHSITKGDISAYYCEGLINFDESSNSDFSNLYFEISGLRDQINGSEGGINYGLNKIPFRFNPHFSDMEAHISQNTNPSLYFLDWVDRVKFIVDRSMKSNQVGVDLEPFMEWTYISNVAWF